MHRDEGGASFRLIDPTNSVTSIVKTFQELGKNLGSIVILPIVRYRPAPTSPRVHEDSKDRCSLLNDRELLLCQSSVFSKKQQRGLIGVKNVSFSRKRFDTWLACATREGASKVSPLPWKGKVIFAWAGGRVKLPCHPRPGPLSRIDRSTEALWARDSFTWGAGEKGDGFKGRSLWDCRFNAVSPINRRPLLLRTHLFSLSHYPRLVHVSGTRWRGANASIDQHYDPRPLLRAWKILFSISTIQDVSWKGNFEEDSLSSSSRDTGYTIPVKSSSRREEEGRERENIAVRRSSLAGVQGKQYLSKAPSRWRACASRWNRGVSRAPTLLARRKRVGHDSLSPPSSRSSLIITGVINGRELMDSAGELSNPES